MKMDWDQAFIDEIKAVPERIVKVGGREILVVDLLRDASPRVHAVFWNERLERGLGGLTMAGGGIYASDWIEWRDRVVREFETGEREELGEDWE